MTVYAIAAGFFAAGLSLVVLVLYGAATVRRCLPAVPGAAVVIAAGCLIALIVLSTITLQQVPEVVRAQPWRPLLLDVVFTGLAVALAVLAVGLRSVISHLCQHGHRDYWHGRPADRRVGLPDRRA